MDYTFKAGSTWSHTDRNSGLKFLIDTGANISLLPKQFNTKGTLLTAFRLYAANGSTINTYGEKLLTLNFGLRRLFKWSFYIAEITRPIIGTDLLKHYGLLVGIKGKCLIDNLTNCTVT